jgi:3-methyladenine DNA glycosylase/8-oxoguanine DNA glycosylase
VGRRFATDRPVDLEATLGPLRFGRDPSWGRPSPGVLAKASLTPEGPGVEFLRVDVGAGEVVQEAFGSGADWLAARLPDLIGETDDIEGFDPPEALRSVARRHPGLRVPRSGLVVESLVPVVIGQKVTGVEAGASYRQLVLSLGQPVGVGPLPGLLVPPSPEQWRAVPSWQWHRMGVGPERATTVVGAMARAGVLERLVAAPHAVARRGLMSLRGVGAWTAAEVAQRVLGDADALSVGDFHVAKSVVYALTGRRNGTDEEMLTLLEDFRGHRFRVQRLVELGHLGQPRRGPRYRGLDHRHR